MAKLLSRWLDIILGHDPKIRRRVSLFMVAVYGYTVCTSLLAYGMSIGLVANGPGYGLIAYMWTGMISFYALVRSDWSSRLGMPGMDLPQCLYAIVAILCAYAITGPLRSSVLILSALVLAFGMLTLTARQVIAMGASTVLSLGLLMATMVHLHPEQFDPRLELITFAMATCTLPAMSAVAVYVAKVRMRLMQQRAELSHALAMLQEVATRDELTGLFNRRHMTLLIEAQILRQQRQGEGFCLALIDLDHFKHINDQHGHHVGDLVLRAFADAAREVLRQTDTLARWGGEEFLLMLSCPEPGIAGAQTALERIREAIAVHQAIPDGIKVRFSAGLTEHPLGEALHATLERADRALYAAKAAGRQRTEVMPSPSPKQGPDGQPLAEPQQV